MSNHCASRRTLMALVLGGTTLQGLVACDTALLSGLPQIQKPPSAGGGGTTPEIQTPAVVPDKAKAGDELTITFTLSEALDTPPLVDVGGNAVLSQESQGTDWTYRYTVVGPSTDSEGTVDIDIHATNASGKTGAAKLQVLFDFTPPAVTVLTTGVSTTLVRSPFDVDATVSDAATGIVSCEVCATAAAACAVADWQPGTYAAGACSRTGIACIDTATETIQARATDGVGNVGTSLAVTRTCDAVGPTVSTPAVVGPDTGTHVGPAFGLSAMVSDTAGLSGCGACKGIGGGCVSASDYAAATLGSSACTATGLSCSDGQALKLAIDATDNAGNVSMSGLLSRTCDAVGPTPTTAVTPNPDISGKVPAVFKVSTAFADIGSGVAGCEYCKVVAPAACDGNWLPATWASGGCSIDNLTCTNGNQLTLATRATDNVGNVGTATAISRTCDATQAVAGTVTVAAPGTASFIPGTFGFADVFNGGGGGGVQSCEYCTTTNASCAAGDWRAASWGSPNCTISSRTCANGDIVTLDMRAVDGMGVLVTSTAISRTCDTQAPQATSTPTVTVNGYFGFVGASFALADGFSDTSGSGVTACQVCVAADGNCNGKWASAVWSAGNCTATSLSCTNGQTLTLAMQAADAVGNGPTVSSVTRSCDAQAPSLGSVGVTSGSSPNWVTPGFVVDTPVGDSGGSGVATCDVCVTATGGLCGGSWTTASVVSGTSCHATIPTCTQGQALEITMRATDNVGNVSGEASRNKNYSCDATPPTATGSLAVSNQATPVYVAGSFDVQAAAVFADPESGVRDCQVCKTTNGDCTGRWSNALWNSGSCSASLTCTDGERLTLNMRARNNAGSDWVSATAITRTCDAAGPMASAVTTTNVSSGGFVGPTFDMAATFTDAAVGGITACSYCEKVGASCGAGDWAAAVYSAGTCTKTGLTCHDGEVLHLAMRAADSFGNTTTVTEITRTCDAAAPTATGAPVIVSNSAVGTIDLSWAASSDGSGVGLAAAPYTIYYDTDAPGAPYASHVSGISGTSASLTGLAPCQRYWIAVTAVDRLGQESSTDDSVIVARCGGDGTFTSSAASLPHAAGRSVLLGDFNEDGVLDLALGYGDTATSAKNLEIRLGNGTNGRGDGTFGSAVASTTSYPVVGVAQGDFNSDSVGDLVLGLAPNASTPPTTLAQTLGNGTTGLGNGAFAAVGAGPTVTSSGAGASMNGVVVVDLDGDGIDDVVSTASAGGGVVLDYTYGGGGHGHGDGTFPAGSHHTVAATGTCSGATGVAVGDFDYDGLVDVVVACGANKTVGIIKNNGASLGPVVTYTAFASAGADQVQAVAVGDFNRDGILDVATANGTANSISVLFGNGTNGRGDGTLRAPTTYATNGSAHTLLAVDLSNDNILDLVSDGLSGGGAAVVSVWLGNGTRRGDGTFGSRTDYAVTSQVYGIAAGDVSGDRVPDLVVIEDTTTQILLGHGSMGFGDGTYDTAYWNPQVGGGLQSVNPTRHFAQGDINADGLADVATIDSGAGIGVNVSDATVVGDHSYAVLVAPTGSNGAILRDVNADHVPDLLVLDSAAGNLDVLLGHAVSSGRGDGTFGPPTQVSFGTSPGASVVVADFNADHALDVAVSVNDGSTYPIRVFLGTKIGAYPDGGFAAGATLTPNPAPTEPLQLAIADLNRDGIMDIVGTAYASTNSAVYVFVGNGTNGKGDGTFTAQAAQVGSLCLNPSGGSYEPSGPVVTDLNRDGIPDVVVACHYQGVGFAVGKAPTGPTYGYAGFAAPGVITWAPSQNTVERHVAVADFNSDGILDVVTGTATQATGAGFAVFLGDGVNGQWNSSTGFHFSGLNNGFCYSSNGFDVLPVDLDGDGILDMVEGCDWFGAHVSAGKGTIQ